MFLRNIRQWFSNGEESRVRRKPTTRPQVEGLEGREVPAALALPNFSHLVSKPIIQVTGSLQAGAAAAAQSATLGQKMANYLQGRLYTRVGGGECAHIATEALRASGADFTRTEPRGTTDYVWTSNRVARLTNGNQLAGKRFQVGDIIQFQNATFSSGGTSKLKHHTQVVAAVDSQGRITKVFEQNVNNNRTVQLRAAINLSKLNGGSVSIYRAMSRVNQVGLVEYTIVNNTNASRTYTLQIGNYTSNTTLTSANTQSSYRVAYATYSGSARPMLKIGTASIQIQHGAAYELYSMAGGKIGIRKI